MGEQFFIGSCLVCGQGMLEIVKEKASYEIFICCDECEAEWDTPDDALHRRNGSRNKYSSLTVLTNSEIIALKWDKYLI